ncbi:MULTISPECIES: SMI1/KNR4 family protein [Niastella]|uniref:SMI1/KNR4 family protein n=1 Tax=Niastella soli TaxID=2821487 RepID=A0ABS3Z087_9BACT|nr:SMI1/KNR4 family protein [Niastella soli]MBO9202781.1 SMI1/KNR4 family protein [Niastella soli]
MTINNLIEELLLFSDKIITLKAPVSEESIIAFERNHNIKLPKDYIELVRKINGLSLMGTIIYGVGEETWEFSLDKNYKLEHEEVANPMYDYLIPFSPDGGGNHYCFDTRYIDDDSCNVIFWQHDYPYTVDDPPEITNPSLTEWIKEVVIDWTLEDYNYDGSEKFKPNT